jgi:hypothetical protein
MKPDEGRLRARRILRRDPWSVIAHCKHDAVTVIVRTQFDRRSAVPTRIVEQIRDDARDRAGAHMYATRRAQIKQHGAIGRCRRAYQWVERRA